MGCYTHPPGSLRRRGRRLPAGRPELVVSAPAFKQARQLTASDGNREVARVVAGFDAQQDRPFAAGPRIRKSLAHLLRRGNALTCNVENDIAVLEALRGRRTVRINLGHDYAVRACTAGPSLCGSATNAPCAFFRPRLSAMSALTGWI